VIQLSEHHLAMVKEILSPYAYQFYVFGSRAKNKARPLSDLDLCIKDKAPVSLHILGEIDAAFEESDLPFKVDVKDWQTMSDTFKNLIEKDLTPLFRL
jgi:predicted nucleotidyltransferase